MTKPLSKSPRARQGAHLLKPVVAALLSACLAPPAQALDFVWQGGTGNWTDANWGVIAVPPYPSQSSHDVIIGKGNAAEDSVVHLFGHMANINNLTINAGDALQMANLGLLLAYGSVTNNGSLGLDSTGDTAALSFVGNATLGGDGQTVMGDSAKNEISGVINNRLTIAAGHTVRGGGRIGHMKITNQGTILADQPGGMAIFQVGGADGFLNAGGLIDIAHGSRIDFMTTTVTGGTLQGQGTARIRMGTLKDIALAGQLTIGNGDFVDIAGTITNNGALKLDSTGVGTSLRINGNTTLTGSGEVVMSDRPLGNLISLAAGGGNTRLTLEQTVRGAGSLHGFKMTNLGKILADQPGGIRLSLTNGTDSLLNAAGVIEVADGSIIDFASGTVSGGLLLGHDSSRLRGGGAGGMLKDLTLEGNFTIGDGDQLALSGLIVNNGTLRMDDSGNSVSLSILGATTLSGGGQTLLRTTRSAEFGNFIRPYSFSSGSLTVDVGHTLRGGGIIAVDAFANLGTVVADEPVGLHFDAFAAGERLINRGTLRIEANSGVTVYRNTYPILLEPNYHTLVQDAAGAQTELFGTLTVSDLQLMAGVLRGTGTVVGDVHNTGGTIIVGASPGKLSIDGDLALGAGGELRMEIDGNQQGVGYDWLAVSGNVALAGLLRLDVNYIPQAGDSFVLVTSDHGVITGEFDSILVNGWTALPTYAGGSLTLTLAPIPEPETWAMLLAGLGLLGWRLTRRRG